MDGASTTRGKVLLAVLIVSAFGPYLYGGIRTEQVAVYALALLLLPWLWIRIRPTPVMAVVLGLWVTLLAVAVFGWIDAPPNRSAFGLSSATANLDNLLLPVAVALVVLAVLVVDVDREALLRWVCALVTIGMSINAIVAIAQTRYSLDAYLGNWWSSSADNVATRALTLGRYTGILNQPALAGVMYGIAILCAMYVLHGHTRRLLLVAALLSIGATLAVSKAFFLVCLPVVVWHMFRTGGKGHQRFAVALFAAAGFYGLAFAGVLPAWTQADKVLLLVPTADTAFVSLYTGNRYGDQSTTTPVVEAVLSSSPVAGFGLNGLDTASDSAWIQVFVVAGLLGIAALAMVMVALVVGYWNRRNRMPEPERRLTAGLVTILVLTSFGFPVLTGNRLAVVAWALLTLLLMCQVKTGRAETRSVAQRELSLPPTPTPTPPAP